MGRTVALKLRDHRFTTVMRQRVLRPATDDAVRVFEVARDLWRTLWRGTPIRLLGVSVSSLERRAADQGELFDPAGRGRRLIEALDGVRDRLGEGALVPAGSLSRRGPLKHVPFGAMARHTRPRSPRSGAARSSGRT